jgi:hypothetical protein
LRLKLLKIGARIRETSRRIWVHLASGYPHRELLAGLVHNLRASPAYSPFPQPWCVNQEGEVRQKSALRVSPAAFLSKK